MIFPPGFDRSIALEAALLVNQAYDQFAHFKGGTNWSLQGNYDPLGLLFARPEGLIARTEPFGFVARNRASGNIFVTFRGTQSLEDWLSNFSFHQKPHPWGQAEKGFLEIYEQCAPSVKTALAAGGPGSKVFVTGHSLGGALATLATADLVMSGISATMYSLAGPRAGDPAFASRFNSEVAAAWRIVNTEDIVTTVPLATPTLFADSQPNSPFGMLLMMARKLNFEHVGVPVSFTTHKGMIATNHEMPTYLEALTA
jgi:hypothetical protein